jgi:ubiquinone/menaquinone biosynthesis C-methylase UbiE
MGKINNKLANAVYWRLFGLFVPMIGFLFTKNHAAYRYFHASAEQFLNQNAILKIMGDANIKNLQAKNFLLGAITLLTGEK